MITAEQRLALATAAIKHVPWQFDRLHGLVYDERDGTQFLPESNPAQLLDVLCWLLSGDKFRSVDGFDVWPYDNKPAIEHNNTPASLSDAVVLAAVLVMEGE